MYRGGYQQNRGPEFYQIGGLGCSVNANSRHPGQQTWKTSKHIAELLFSSTNTQNGLDLVFGIKPSGAGYVLMPKATESRSRLFTGRTYDGSSFICLSPVHFPDVAALEARLDLLENPAKRKKNKTEVPRDRSVANRGFTTSSNGSIITADGSQRASFEHQRLLMNVAQNALDNSALSLYNLAPAPWLRQLKIVTFAHNLWQADHRGKLERGDDLKLVDVGWTEYTFTNGLSVQPESTVHLKVQENSVLTNKNPAAFLYGTTKVLSTDAIRSRLQQVLGPNGGDSQSPVLLLVSNEEKALHALRVLGADPDPWHHGVAPILGLRPLSVGEDAFGRRDRDPGLRSERSRSPHRDTHRDLRPSRIPRPRSPLRGPASPHPVYVVDVARLYKMVTDQPAADDNIRAMSGKLGVETDDGHSLSQLTSGWCAGNESRLLAMLWRKIVSGNAIDEQRYLFRHFVVRDEAETKPTTTTTNEVNHDDDSDEDIDPNDEPVVKAAPPPKSKDPYEILDDEDDDY